MMEKGEFYCSGVSSLVGRYGEHVLFMDMDGHSLDDTIKVATEIIHKYMLSNCYIFCSSKDNHHIICLDKFDFGSLYSILKRHAHKQWVKFRSKSEDFVLRMSEKGEKPEPSLMCIVESPYKMRGKSNAHRVMLNKRYGLKIKKDEYFDDNIKLKIHVYRTRMVKR